jgi:dinuclear metal center YbgI/SA1388 family protein
MKVSDIITAIELFAPPQLAEDWDNGGLLTGEPGSDCSGVLCTLDVTLQVIREAKEKGCNLVVSHHPVIFKGLKKVNGGGNTERIIIEAVKNDIALYAAHTALDTVLEGVSGGMAAELGLRNVQVLSVKKGTLRKLTTFAPVAQAEKVRQALFAAGAGHVGNYSECSFNGIGTGTFKAGKGADPFVGEIGARHSEEETRIEVVFPGYSQGAVLSALIAAHPYEEVAYDVLSLQNDHPGFGTGVIGDLETPLSPGAFLQLLESTFGTGIIRHSPLREGRVQRVALCGGSGAFLIGAAAARSADFYVTADLKYHDFFLGEGKMVIADIGHFESEQFAPELLYSLLVENFPTFAVLKTSVNTNPVRYFRGTGP